jgi:radical SAM superfamily enzyme YgiQ (UPF0313 family)
MNQKIQLIYPKSRPFLDHFKYCFPLGILSIATFLNHKNPDLDIEPINGEQCTERKLLKKTDADIVGLSSNLMNYGNAIKIAQRAKERGSKVILGGPHTRYFHDLILRNRDCFDAVVVGDGEKAFADIVEGKPFEKINNLVFKKGKRIIHNPVELLDPDKVPFPDRGFIKRNFSSRIVDFFNRRRPANYYSQKGCLWKKNRGGCMFCAVEDPYRARGPENVWKEIRCLYEKFNARMFHDLSAAPTMDKKWLHDFVKIRPMDIISDIEFRIWSRTSDITEKTAEMLYKLNVSTVSLGAESGSNDILRNIKKGTAVEQNLRAVKLLKKYGIGCTLSFIFGLPGEKESTLKDTVEHAKKLVKEGDIRSITCTVMNPLPGSVSLEMLKRKANVIHGDVVYLREMEEKWVEHFTDVDMNKIYDAIDDVLDLGVPYKVDRRVEHNY